MGLSPKSNGEDALGRDMMPYLIESYAWSEAYRGSISSVPFGSDGITGISAIICRQLLKNTMPGVPVSSSTFSNS